MASERKRRPTSTSAFGVSRREGHDASGFYARFEVPIIADDETIAEPTLRDEIVVGDARDMSKIPDNSVVRDLFPVELPARCIQLFTYAGDTVLDPFMGSGTTAVAAIEAGRHYVGYELDGSYADRAAERITQTNDRRGAPGWPRPQRQPSTPKDPVPSEDLITEAQRTGLTASDLSARLLERSGFTDITKNVRLACGVRPWRTAVDPNGRRWVFLLAGAFTGSRAGMATSDVVWETIGQAAASTSDEGWTRRRMIWSSC